MTIILGAAAITLAYTPQGTPKHNVLLKIAVGSNSEIIWELKKQTALGNVSY